MSIKVMNWAWEQDLKPTHKLILMRLADFSNNKGFVDSCSYRQLMDDVGVAKGTIVSKLNDLKSWNHISVINNRRDNGGHAKNSFMINMDGVGGAGDDTEQGKNKVYPPCSNSDQGASADIDQGLGQSDCTRLGQIADQGKEQEREHSSPLKSPPGDIISENIDSDKEKDDIFHERFNSFADRYHAEWMKGKGKTVKMSSFWRPSSDEANELAEILDTTAQCVQAIAVDYAKKLNGLGTAVRSPMWVFLKHLYSQREGLAKQLSSEEALAAKYGINLDTGKFITPDYREKAEIQFMRWQKAPVTGMVWRDHFKAMPKAEQRVIAKAMGMDMPKAGM